MKVESTSSVQAPIEHTAKEVLRVVTGHEDDRTPPTRIMAEFSLLTADQQVDQPPRRFRAFAIGIVALAAATCIGLYFDFGVVTSQFFELAGDRSISLGTTEGAPAGLEETLQENAALKKELAVARDDFEAMAKLLHDVQSETPPLQPTAIATAAELQQARQKIDALTDELADARRDLETKQATSSTASDEAAQLKKSAEAATAELQQEHQKTAALTDELASARRELETKQAMSSTAAEAAAQLKKSAEATTAELQQERQKTAALMDELATVRRDFAAKLVSIRKADGEVAQPKQSAKVATTEGQPGRQKTAPPMRSLDRVRPAIEISAASDRIARGRSVQAEPSDAPAAWQSRTPPIKVDPKEARLMARANGLLGRGDISGARIVLERAIEMGSARANFAIAETYDPRVLSSWKTYGTRADAAIAREYYAKAAASGIEEAKDRLESLRGEN